MTEAEILKLLTDAGVFDYDKKTAHLPYYKRYDYIMAEGKGEQQLDFSTKPDGLRKLAKLEIKYVLVKGEYLEQLVSHVLFYVEGVAHNWFNFGNFLFGAAGAALGLTWGELSFGAQYNSLANSEQNGYKSQLDSDDDQRSIRLGYEYARTRNYSARVQRQWGKPRTP